MLVPKSEFLANFLKGEKFILAMELDGEIHCLIAQELSARELVFLKDVLNKVIDRCIVEED